METLDVEQQRPEMNMFCHSTTLIEGKRVANSSCQPHHLFILFDRFKIFLFKERYTLISEFGRGIRGGGEGA